MELWVLALIGFGLCVFLAMIGFILVKRFKHKQEPVISQTQEKKTEVRIIRCDDTYRIEWPNEVLSIEGGDVEGLKRYLDGQIKRLSFVGECVSNLGVYYPDFDPPKEEGEKEEVLKPIDETVKIIPDLSFREVEEIKETLTRENGQTPTKRKLAWHIAKVYGVSIGEAWNILKRGD
ncbi:MAG: hypothetical protein JW778_04035 [Candidatus Altiarchaeota archaeon]|nr:hypothetical protein [Candidatus Altiarchaeota archaeon]